MSDARLFGSRSLSSSGMAIIGSFGHFSLSHGNPVEAIIDTDNETVDDVLVVAPEFISTPILHIEQGVEYAYEAVATVGEIVVQSAPDWISRTGSGTVATLRGTPQDVGQHSFVLVAVHAELSVLQRFTITVDAAVSIL